MGSLTGENTFLEARTEAEQLRSRIPVATQPADSENYCTGGTSGAKNEDRRGSVGDVTPPETDVDIDDTLLQLLRRSSICSGAFGKSGSNSKVYYSPASKTHNEKSLVRSKLRNPAKRDSLAGQLRPSDCAHLKRLTHAHLNSLNLSNPPRLSYCRALEVLTLNADDNFQRSFDPPTRKASRNIQTPRIRHGRFFPILAFLRFFICTTTPWKHSRTFGACSA